jgi:hypothetical protein
MMDNLVTEEALNKDLKITITLSTDYSTALTEIS